MNAILCTFFRDFTARTKREELTELPALAQMIATTSENVKARLPWLKLARFGDKASDKGSLRFDGNVIAITGVEGDADDGSIDFDEAIEIARAAELFCLLYTSPGHSDDHPRWRVLAPTSHELPPEERARLVARLNGLFRGALAVESFTLSQSYYYGRVANNAAHRVELIDGTPVDLLDRLDVGAIGKPNGAGPQPGAAPGPLDEAALITAIVSGNAYHTSCTRLVGRWAQQGVPFMDAQQRLEEIFGRVFPLDRDQRWHDRRADIPRIIRDIYGKESGKRDAEDYVEFTLNGHAQDPGTQRAGSETDTGSESAESAEAESPEPEPAPAAPAWLSLQQLRDAEFGEPDFLLGELLSTTSRVALIGPTGIGKSNLLFAMSLAAAAGQGFLHWRGRRGSRVLYLDGEMSPRLLRARAIDAIGRAGGLLPDTLFFLSHALYEEMQPLNYPAGQRIIDQQIALLGGIDLLIIDNVQSLMTGDMKDELPWQQALPWVRDLTKRHIGQVWVHHTGHDETHGYGTKTREWQLDTVMLMQREDPGAADIKFRLEFTKARERTPLNRADFEPRLITLAGDTWTSEVSENSSGGRRQTAKDRAYELLCDAIARWGEFPQQDKDGLPPVGQACVKERAWRQRCADGNISEPTLEAQRQAFNRAAKALINEGRVCKHGDWVWVVRQ